MTEINTEKDSKLNQIESTKNSEFSEMKGKNRVTLSNINAQMHFVESQFSSQIFSNNAQTKVKIIEFDSMAEQRENDTISQIKIIAERANTAYEMEHQKQIRAEAAAQREFSAKGEKAQRVVLAEAHSAERKIISQATSEIEFLEKSTQAKVNLLANQVKSTELKLMMDIAGSEGIRCFKYLELLPKIAEHVANASRFIKFDKVVIWGKANPASYKSRIVSSIKSIMP